MLRIVLVDTTKHAKLKAIDTTRRASYEAALRDWQRVHAQAAQNPTAEIPPPPTEPESVYIQLVNIASTYSLSVDDLVHRVLNKPFNHTHPRENLDAAYAEVPEDVRAELKKIDWTSEDSGPRQDAQQGPPDNTIHSDEHP